MNKKKLSKLVLAFGLVMSLLTGCNRTPEVSRAEDDVAKFLQDKYGTPVSVCISDDEIYATFSSKPCAPLVWREKFSLSRNLSKDSHHYKKTHEKTVSDPYFNVIEVVDLRKKGDAVMEDPRARDLLHEVNKRVPFKPNGPNS